jgi:hypothetical protein
MLVVKTEGRARMRSHGEDSVIVMVRKPPDQDWNMIKRQ